MVLAYGHRCICIRSSTTHLRVLSAYPTATAGFTSKELVYNGSGSMWFVGAAGFGVDCCVGCRVREV